jgi:thiol-disulfide isomerase/thioredoxin
MSKSNSGPARPTSTRPANGASSTRSNAVGAKQPSGRTPTRASFRSRHPVMTALVPVGLVVAVIATMVVIKATGGSAAPSSSHLQAAGTNQSGQTGTTALSSTVAADLTVPATTLDAVGSPSGDSLPTATGAASILKDQDGKPIVTYVGAEYCPYCAAERWALAVALSRFGTFTNLSSTHSASNDVYPNTQTLSFYGSSYSSSYVDFEPVEEATNQVVNGSYQTLQTPTAAQSALLAKYDAAGSIPFLDIANKYVVTGASYSPQVLQGLSRDQIAAQLSDPSSAVAQAIDGTANAITAAVSNVTGNQPSSVANSSAVAAIVKKLAA